MGDRRSTVAAAVALALEALLMAQDRRRPGPGRYVVVGVVGGLGAAAVGLLRASA